jgi:hypothetical protein
MIEFGLIELVAGDGAARRHPHHEGDDFGWVLSLIVPGVGGWLEFWVPFFDPSGYRLSARKSCRRWLEGSPWGGGCPPQQSTIFSSLIHVLCSCDLFLLYVM